WPEKIEKIRALWKLETATPFSAAANTILPIARTHGVIATRQDATIVAFAGTDPLVVADWVTDFDAFPSPKGLHSGFQLAADVAWSVVEDAVKTRGGRNVVFTGHSLGGAIAIISAERVSRELEVTPTSVYTFGSPRPGSEQFAQQYKSSGPEDRTFRLVHGTDLV